MHTRYKYIVRRECKQCRHVLSHDEACLSDGVCPYCGKVSEGTIVDYKKVIVQLTQTKKYWFLSWKTVDRKIVDKIG